MTAQIIPVDPDNERTLARHATEIRRLGKRAVSDVIEIGRLLVESKKLAGHGNWLPWLEKEFGWTDKTAENFMNVARFSADKIETVSNLNLPLSGLYLLAAPSTPEVAKQEAISRAEAGEPIPLNTVKEIVGRARQGDRPEDLRGERAEWKTEPREDYIRRWIYDEKDNLSELITDYLNHQKRYLEKSTEWSIRPRRAPADNELRKAFRKEAILEIFHVQGAYWHDDVVRDALSAAIEAIRPSAAKGKRKSK
jgi:DUF3102 family protein